MVMIAVVGSGMVVAASFVSITGTGTSQTTVHSTSLTSTSQATLVPASTSSSSSSTSTTASSSPTTSSIATSLSASASSLGSTSTNTTTCSPFQNNLIRVALLNTTLPKVTDLLGNFSAMTISSQLGVNASAIESYNVVGRPVIDSLRYYEVNVSTSAGSPSSNFSINIPSTVWFAPNGTAMMVKSKLGNFTGSSAQLIGGGLLSTFLQELQTSALARNITSSSDFKILNESTVSLGPTKVNITTYELKSLPVTNCGVTISKLIESVGTIPGTKFLLVLNSDLRGSSQTSPIVLKMKVESITVAQS